MKFSGCMNMELFLFARTNESTFVKYITLKVCLYSPFYKSGVGLNILDLIFLNSIQTFLCLSSVQVLFGATVCKRILQF